MNYPEHLRYTAEHEWVSLDNGVATVGITEFAQSELGDIVFVELDKLGQTLDQHQVFGTVEAVKTVSDLYMPLSGEILEVNSLILDQPERVNQQPYEDGWMIKISISNPSEWELLMDASAYQAHPGR